MFVYSLNLFIQLLSPFIGERRLVYVLVSNVRTARRGSLRVWDIHLFVIDFAGNNFANWQGWNYTEQQKKLCHDRNAQAAEGLSDLGAVPDLLNGYS